MDDRLVDWLESLAAKQPTPGGGAVAALSAATAAALVGMVSIYTTGGKWEDCAEQMQSVHDEAATLRQEALDLMAADATAFARVGEAYKLPKESDADKAARAAAIQEALIGAAEPPKQTAELAAKILLLTEKLVDAGNPNVISDVAVAASNARAALESAIVNIEINEQLITDEIVKDGLRNAVADATTAITKADAITAAVRQRIRRA